MRYKGISTRQHLTVNWDVVWSLSKPPSCSITPFEELHFIHHWRMLEKWQLSCFVAALLRNKKSFLPSVSGTKTLWHSDSEAQWKAIRASPVEGEKRRKRICPDPSNVIKHSMKIWNGGRTFYSRTINFIGKNDIGALKQYSSLSGCHSIRLSWRDRGQRNLQ